MIQEWYFIRDGAKRGPLTTSEVAEMLADVELDPRDLVWKEGMTQWEPTLQRPEFFPQIPQTENKSVAVEALDYATPGSQVTHSGGQEFPRLPYAGIGRRFIASIVDAIILNAAFALLARAAPARELGNANIRSLADLVSPFAAWFYFAFTESSAAQGTFGMQWLGIIVTDSAGQRISFARATGRYFAMLLSILTLGFGFLLACFTRKTQTLHDMIADTLVLRKPLF
jgi:uncharacterized RDD family membrane protein YckC